MKSRYARLKKCICVLLVLLLNFQIPTAFAAKKMVYVVGKPVSTNMATATGKYSPYWQYWSQGASTIGPNFRKYGCFFIAQCKALVELGIVSSNTSQFNPDIYVNELGNNIAASDYIKTYASRKGKTVEKRTVKLTSNNAKDAQTIMSYLQAGWVCILYCSNIKHFSYVLRNASLERGEPVISDSFSNLSWSNDMVFTMASGPNKFKSMHVYRLPDPEKPQISNVRITDKTSDSYTISCDVSDNMGIKRVDFPTWTEANEMDDLSNPWPSVPVTTKAGEVKTVSYTVRAKDHNREFGRYLTNIYAYDLYGNYTLFGWELNSVLAVDVPVPSRYWKNFSTSSVSASNAIHSAQFVFTNSTTDEMTDIISGTMGETTPAGFYMMAGTNKTEVLNATISSPGATYWATVTPAGETSSNNVTTYGMPDTAMTSLKNASGTYMTLSANSTYYYKWIFSAGSAPTDSAVQSVTTTKQGDTVKYNIDVNGILDGVDTGNLNGFGYFDMFIDDGTTTYTYTDLMDYTDKWPAGTTWQISNIRAADGKIYSGLINGSLSGTVGNEPICIRLAFDTKASLNVECYLDGTAVTQSSVVAFDVYIDGVSVAENVPSFQNVFNNSTVSYEIKNITCGNSVAFDSVAIGSLTGSADRGTRTVRLEFSSVLELTSEWTELNSLPDNLDFDNCEIQVMNHYSTVSATSPGEDWIRGEAVNTYYADSGERYTNYGYPLTTSETRVCVQQFYYHYCDNNKANQTSGFASNAAHSTYHVAGAPSTFNIKKQVTDPDDNRYQAYMLTWKSGQWAGGVATCSAGKGYFYMAYVYQDRIQVTEFKWYRSSEWTTEQDKNADYVTYRVRSISTHTLTFDANGGRYDYPLLTAVDGEETYIPLITPFRNGYRFLGWSRTKDGSGEIWSPGDYITASDDMTLYAQWTSLKSLVFPSKLKEVQKESFLETAAERIVIPDGCTKIGDFAFGGCTRLIQVVLPDTITSISSTAFSGTMGVVIIAPSGSYAEMYANSYGYDFCSSD